MPYCLTWNANKGNMIFIYHESLASLNIDQLLSLLLSVHSRHRHICKIHVHCLAEQCDWIDYIKYNYQKSCVILSAASCVVWLCSSKEKLIRSPGQLSLSRTVISSTNYCYGKKEIWRSGKSKVFVKINHGIWSGKEEIESSRRAMNGDK